MNTPLRRISLLLALALGLTTGLTLSAQDNPPPPPNAEAPAAPDAPAAPASDEDEKETASDDEAPAGMRRLDVESPRETADATVDEAAPVETSEPAAKSDTGADTESDEREDSQEREESRHHHGGANERFAVGDNSRLGAGEEADAVISIFGSSNSEGHVNDAVVSILGSSTASGEIKGDVVAVLGNSRFLGGRAGGSVVSILGNTYINGEVGGEAIAVLGNVELGPKAVVHGEVVCIGGRVKRDPAAVVNGQVNNVAFGFTLGGFEWLQAWVKKCLLWGRPLAFGEHLMWAWWLAFGFLAFYVVLGLLFPRGVEKCARTFEESPGFSILTALMVTLLAPLAAVVLVITVLGTPALAIALLIAGLFGKAVMLAWIGRRITNHFSGPLAGPAMAVLVGGVIVLLLYTVPFVGFILMKLLAWLGIGVVVYTIIQMNRRPMLAASAAGAAGPTMATTMATPAVAPDAPVVPLAAPSDGVVGPTVTGAAVPPVSPVPPVMPRATPVVVSAATMPRAGFWIRIGASVLDFLIVAIAVKAMPHFWQPNLMLIFATYCCVMWGFKGTTVGGIVCGLKIVRLDDRPVDWPTAIVRALGGFLSLAAAGIGFIWVAFDDQKQSWHDKIAGTTIVHVPRGVSLV